MSFQYRQIRKMIMHALLQHWKKKMKHFAGNLSNFYIQDHHLKKCSTISSLEKLNSWEHYLMQLLLKYDKISCQDYCKKKFDEFDFNWKLI